MRKSFIFILCLLTIFLCWFYLKLDEKERGLLFLQSDKKDDLYSFKEFPMEFDDYLVFLRYNNKDYGSLGELVTFTEEWNTEIKDIKTIVKLHSSFFTESNQTLISIWLKPQIILKDYEVIQVLNQEGYYRNIQDNYIDKDSEEIIYFHYEEIIFDLEGISYSFYIQRKSSSHPLEAYGANQLINLFFNNNFEK